MLKPIRTAWRTARRTGAQWLRAGTLLLGGALALGQVRIVAAFRAQDFAAAQRWCGVAGAAFLTPYAYLFLAGHAEMPAYATVALATLVAVMAAASILRVRQQCVGCDPLPAVELAFADEV